MRLLHILSLFALSVFLLFCTPAARYASAPGGYGNNAGYNVRSTPRSSPRTVSGQLPANPDPNKCYVRAVSPDEFEYEPYAELTYTEEEALLYPHEEIVFTVREEVSRWESTTYEGCESDDPNDCQVLCYRTYPAETLTIYAPRYDTLGSPVVLEFEVEELVRKGGLSSYVEIDCELTAFNEIPLAFEPGSARLSVEARQTIDDGLLTLLSDMTDIRVEINAHTSTQGSAASNPDLSERRAKSVADYLVGRGIIRQRLITKGYGESKPKNRCANGVDCSEEEHAVNRRIEFRVVNVDMK